MEIYETISHVSTNQVWLHINFASSRVYFRPFTLCFSILLGRCGPTYQKLPSWYPTSLATLSPRLETTTSLLHFCFLRSSARIFPSLARAYPSPSPVLLLPSHSFFLSDLIRLIPIHAIVNPLSYSSPEIVSLNHPRLLRNTEAPF